MMLERAENTSDKQLSERQGEIAGKLIKMDNLEWQLLKEHNVPRTGIGGTHVVDLQLSEQLPRIC